MSKSLACVVDANIAAKLFVPEPLSDKADVLFAHLADVNARLCVPDVFYVEMGSVLLKLARNKWMTANDAALNLQTLMSLRLKRFATYDLVVEAFRIGTANMIAMYDAVYVTLAARLGVPLITDDERLAQAMAHTEYDVRTLAEFEFPAA